MRHRFHSYCLQKEHWCNYFVFQLSQNPFGMCNYCKLLLGEVLINIGGQSNCTFAFDVVCLHTVTVLRKGKGGALYNCDPFCDQAAECVISKIDVLHAICAFVVTPFSNSCNAVSLMSAALPCCKSCGSLLYHCITLLNCYTASALKIWNVYGFTLVCLQLNQFFWQCVLSGIFFLSRVWKEVSLREMLYSLGGNVQWIGSDCVWTWVADQIYDGCDGKSRPVSFQLPVRALELNTRIKERSLSVAWPAVL